MISSIPAASDRSRGGRKHQKFAGRKRKTTRVPDANRRAGERAPGYEQAKTAMAKGPRPERNGKRVLALPAGPCQALPAVPRCKTAAIKGTMTAERQPSSKQAPPAAGAGREQFPVERAVDLLIDRARQLPAAAHAARPAPGVTNELIDQARDTSSEPLRDGAGAVPAARHDVAQSRPRRNFAPACRARASSSDRFDPGPWVGEPRSAPMNGKQHLRPSRITMPLSVCISAEAPAPQGPSGFRGGAPSSPLRPRDHDPSRRCAPPRWSSAAARSRRSASHAQRGCGRRDASHRRAGTPIIALTSVMISEEADRALPPPQG